MKRALWLWTYQVCIAFICIARSICSYAPRYTPSKVERAVDEDIRCMEKTRKLTAMPRTELSVTRRIRKRATVGSGAMPRAQSRSGRDGVVEGEIGAFDDGDGEVD